MSGEAPLPPPDDELPKDPLLDQVATHVDEAIARDMGDDIPDTVIRDKDTAHARANAEYKDTVQAMEKRKAAQAIDDFVPVDKAEGESSWDVDPKNNRAFDEQVTQHHPILEKEFPHTLGYMGEETGHSIERGEPRRFAKLLHQGASKNDELASRKGDWAEILHDHPVSAEYLKEKKIGEVDPGTLVAVEYNIDELLREAEEWSGKLAELDASIAEARIRNPMVNHMAVLNSEIYDIASPDSYAKFQTLVENDDTTMGQVKKFYDDLCQAKAAAKRVLAASGQSILDDVKSGKASSNTVATDVS